MGSLFLGGLFGRTPDPIYNIQYGTDKQQCYDLYRPKRSNGITLFIVHGGGWHRGDKEADGVIANKVAHYLPLGYTIISVNYRTNTDPYSMAQDVAQALAHSQSKASAYKVSPKKFVLMGHSAGAHLIALVLTDKTLMKRAGVGYAPLGSIELDSAAYNVVDIMQNLPADPELRALYVDAFGDNPAYWLQCSPYHQLSAKTCPMLLVYSTQRGPGDRNAVMQFADKLTTYHGYAQILPQNLTHGQINANLGLDSAYTRTVDEFIIRVTK